MRVEKVVYVLGAGFSAPLGIPVVSQFTDRARNLFEESPDQYAHFKPVFADIRGLHEAASRVGVDPENIEDVLSVFTMRDSLLGTDSAAAHRRFIADVVRGTTPPINKPTNKTGHTPPHMGLFGERWTPHAAFALNLLGLHVQMHGSDVREVSQVKDRRVEYAVVSLNYDMVVETPWSILSGAMPPPDAAILPIRLAKLHGSIEDDSIIPPTWNKAIATPEMIATWKSAMEWLREAHHIRIIGYSFPWNDAYVRYLFAVALRDSFNLKSVDMLCHDPDDSVRERFRRAITFKRRRFMNRITEAYLSHLIGGGARTVVPEGRNVMTATYDRLESVHANFFAEAAAD